MVDVIGLIYFRFDEIELARIYIEAYDQSSITRPFGLVMWGEFYLENIAAESFIDAGDLLLLFEAPVSADNHQDVAFDFGNRIGAILADLGAIAGTEDYLDVRRFTKMDGPSRADKQDKVDFMQVLFKVEYGPAL